MSDEGWFYSKDQQQHGPLPFEALQQLVTSQELRQDDLVWQTGTFSWVPVHSVPELRVALGSAPPMPPALPRAPRPSLEEQYGERLHELRHRVGALDQVTTALQALPHLRLIHRLLTTLGQKVTVHQLDAADRLMKRIGNLAYVATALLYTAFFAVVSLKADSIQQLLATVLIIIPCASILHYIAVHFLESGEDLLRQTPTQLSSRTLATSLGLLAGAAGVLILVFASQDLFRKIEVVESIAVLPLGIVLIYAAAILLNPGSLNLETEARNNAVREAIGISLLLVKLPLRLIPMTFGLYSLVAAASAAYFVYQLTGEQFELRHAQALAIAPTALLVGALPLALYLVAVFGTLLIDLLRSLLDTAEGVRELATARPEGRSGPAAEE